MTLKQSYKHIAIEGNIGVGKTTLAKKMALLIDAELVLEKFRKNHFLPLFYDDMDKYGLHVELSFLVDRLEDYSGLATQQRVIVSDYFFLKTLLFAKVNLDKHAFKIFERVFNNFETKVSKPDLIIFLQRDIQQLLQNIKSRNRGNEQQIGSDYLGQVQKSYSIYLNKTQDYKILSLDVSDADLRKDSTVSKVISLLDNEYPHGITKVKL